MPYIPLATQSANAPYNGERLLNWFPVVSEAASGVILKTRSGLKEKHSVGAVQAMDQGQDQQGMIVVAGGKLW